MRFVSLPCAVSCLALACATFACAALGCAVPDVQFYPDDASTQDGAAGDAPVDTGGDAPTDGPTDGPADAGEWSCPDATPPGFDMCCGAIPCFGIQCSNSMLCTKCQQCPSDPGVVCCVKMNTADCHNVLDSGPCP
jgi:hypothetical protein